MLPRLVLTSLRRFPGVARFRTQLCVPLRAPQNNRINRDNIRNTVHISSQHCNNNSLKKETTPYVNKIHTQLRSRFLEVVWSNGEVSRYPKIFLRENCKCVECFEPSSKQRSLDIVRNGLRDTTMKEVEVSKNGEQLECLWSNGHRSVYSAEWLHARRMPEQIPEPEHRNVDNIVHENIFCWDHSLLQDKIPCYKYDAIMNDDRSLFDCLYSLYQYGVMLVENSPAGVGAGKDITRKLGYLRTTHYGDYFDVQTKPDASNLAYTSNDLPFHVDLPLLSNPPDFQMLHCIEQADGNTEGTNLFVDGFYVAKKLMKDDPEGFKIICETAVTYQDVGIDVFGEFSCKYAHPIVSLNTEGGIDYVMMNIFSGSDYFKNMTPDQVMNYYDAFYKLRGMVNDPVNIVRHRLRAGEMIFFYNKRVMHSRTSISSTTERFLRGYYYDSDVVFSKLRVLHEKLALNTPKLPRDSNDFY